MTIVLWVCYILLTYGAIEIFIVVVIIIIIIITVRSYYMADHFNQAT